MRRARAVPGPRRGGGGISQQRSRAADPCCLGSRVESSAKICQVSILEPSLVVFLHYTYRTCVAVCCSQGFAEWTAAPYKQELFRRRPLQKQALSNLLTHGASADWEGGHTVAVSAAASGLGQQGALYQVKSPPQSIRGLLGCFFWANSPPGASLINYTIVV